MWDLTYDTNEPICETEADSWTQRRVVVAKGEGKKERDGLGGWGWQM